MSSSMSCGQNLQKEFPTKYVMDKSINVYTLAPSTTPTVIREVVKFKDGDGCCQKAVILKTVYPDVLTFTETATVQECVDVEVLGKKESCQILKQVFPNTTTSGSYINVARDEDYREERPKEIRRDRRREVRRDRDYPQRSERRDRDYPQRLGRREDCDYPQRTERREDCDDCDAPIRCKTSSKKK